MFVPVAEVSIAKVFPTRRGERISLFTAATCIGRLIAPLLGAYIVVMTNGGLPYKNFNELYLVAGVAGVAAFITTLPFLAEKRQPTHASQKEADEVVKQMFYSWRMVVRNRSALVVSLVQASQYYA